MFALRCPECQGTRYRPEILEVTYRGKNIAEVLDLTAREALSFFRNRPKVQARLRPMLDIGLDYLRLGQPLSHTIRRRGAAAQARKLPGPHRFGAQASRRGPSHTSSCSTSPPPACTPLTS